MKPPRPIPKRTRVRPLPPIVQALRQWRAANGVSVRVTHEVMGARGFGFPTHTLRAWEAGRMVPGRYASQLLAMFLAQHPQVDDAPHYRPGRKPREP